MQTATLAGGCFWCLEPIFRDLQGVKEVKPGYSGGNIPDPSYKKVCTGQTGHAEVVQIIFDPTIISFKEILEVFFAVHDPTTLNRQGDDVGTQYRSAVFYHTSEQKKNAANTINELNNKEIWDNPIVTEITPFHSFYPAEDYHFNYYKNNSEQLYCRMVISPKLDKFRKRFNKFLKRKN